MVLFFVDSKYHFITLLLKVWVQIMLLTESRWGNKLVILAKEKYYVRVDDLISNNLFLKWNRTELLKLILEFSKLHNLMTIQ